ncbi:YesU family protein [Paenibacillus sp. P26]|nr:YesU family protein [Paenibacillus sp. P26]
MTLDSSNMLLNAGIGAHGEIEGELIYDNPLSGADHLAGFRMEGPGEMSFPAGRSCLESRPHPSEGQRANFVLWCPAIFPDGIAVTWDFWPVREPGLCMLFFAAQGRDGKDLFDPSFAPRDGQYGQYHHGEMNAYHVAYFRRALQEERAFHVCNLRKSYGLHLIAQGADPIPGVSDAEGPYRMRLLLHDGEIRFSINGLPVLQWKDDGVTYGPVLRSGRIGFRQLAPLIADYANLKVYKLKDSR